MSVLNLPRLNFSGQALWNPDTPNNSPGVYDEVTLLQNPDIPPATFVDWLKSLSSNPPPGQASLNGSWNTYGDGGCWFRDVVVGGVQFGYGQSTSDDPICNKSQIQIVGQRFGSPGPARMVDVAPYQSTTTQLFFKWLQLGDETLGFRASGAPRMYLRWSMLRNELFFTDPTQLPIAGPAGVIFQTAALAKDIEWFGVEKSPALQKLQQEATTSPNQGIVIQFAVYLTEYYKNASFNGQPITSAQELATAYANGFTDGNPAQSTITGTIGVWGPNELATAPTQILLNPANPVLPSVPTLPTARAVLEGLVVAATQPPQPLQLGPAMVNVDAEASNLALSFVTTIIETDLDATKANYGDLLLQVTGSSGNVLSTIATIPYASRDLKGYDQPSYRHTSGILDFPLTPDQLALVQTPGNLLQIFATNPNTVVLQQTPLVVETDDRGTYLDQSESTTITVAVYENGVPAGDGVSVLVSQYYEAPLDTSFQFPYYLVTAGNLGQACISLSIIPPGQPVTVVPQLTLQVQNGTISIPMTSVAAGTAMLGFQPFPTGTTPPAPTPGGPGNFPSTSTTTFYAIVRCLGFDNQLFAIPDDQVNWTNTYNMVLQTYNLVYPKMSLIMDLADESVVNSMAKQILAVTDYPANFLWTMFMPVTREMSAGRRHLLRRYCLKVINGQA